MLLDILGGKTREPAECIISVSGREVGEFYPFLLEITAECSRSAATEARLRFETRRNEQGRWTIQDAGVFVPWAPVKIEAAFGSRREEIMRGYIREVAADYPQTPGDASVTVTCQDESIALDREHKRRNWGGDVPASDQAILAAVAGEHGLAPDPGSDRGQSGLVLNQDATDIVFLQQRAAANGYELIFREGRIYFGPMRVGVPPQETIMVYAGPDTHCFRFTARADGHRPDRVILQLASASGASVEERTVGPDLQLMGRESADSSGSGLPEFAWRMSRQGGRNEAELLPVAQRLANENAMKVRADGELDGTLYGHVLLPGLPVAVDGVGEWLSGIYYVDQVSHRFSVEGYRQGFTLLRNAYGDNVPAGGSVLAGVM